MPGRREKKWVELPSRSNARIAADVQPGLEGWIDERAAELRALVLGESVRMIATGMVFGIPLALLLASPF